ncbi:MAG: 2-oxoglutarate dehydrogenase complex dihydrolipoyllysine-residue succinyltransferase [Bacteroidales bacterium]|nr:2-oxoglutarate dehydrogenase complex dihydrolipoyllysine-residue succinyltransferase [Bacteroidales bacterium]
MIIEIKVPSPGESISEVQLANWFFANGDFVEKDAEIAEIDSDKATLTINASEAGKIAILVEAGETVEVGTVICTIDTEAEGAPKTEKNEEKPAVKEEKKTEKQPEQKAAAKEPVAAKEGQPAKSLGIHISPLAKKLLEANKLSESDLVNFYKKLRLSKDDVVQFIDDMKSIPTAPQAPQGSPSWGGHRETDRKKMTTLRLKLAERLVAVKNETAMLTTFNEVNMTPIMQLRNKYKDAFKEKYGVSLGFMSFFTKAITEALQHFPQVNAQIDGNEIIYHNYADIGIAVSAPKGLMVPIIRNAETLMLHEIEAAIKDLATKARNGKLTIEEMTGGTFTITNGGVFGSMLSTPIINPPQSAILGMHNIVERPIAVNGKVEIHPIMYVAMSYDHRIIDGRESVSFLVKVKEMLEDPARMLFAGNDPEKVLLGL